jgi:hypothetical protein
LGLTLVTVTLPERKGMLGEMLASVAGQTVMPDAHVIVWDDGRGFVGTVNRAVGLVDTDYFCLVDDDDLLLPNHVETLKGNLQADVVWTWCEVRGRSWNPNSGYQPGVLQQQNYIPSNHACRTELFRRVGGYRHGQHPDHGFLARAEQAGATFLNVPTVTWVYRFHGGNMSQ